jgi:ATP synthase protein I
MQVNDARMFRGAAIPTALAGLVAVIVSSLVAGVKGGIGAGAATFVVLVFFGLGLFALQHFSRKMPELFMGVAMITYTTQLLLLAIVLAVFKDTSLFNTQAFGLTVLGTALVWIAAMLRAHTKLKILYVDPDSTSSSKTGSKAGERQDKSTGEH